MLKPYAKYKETPALWLNSIPDHWESHKIRELFVERSEKVSDKDYSPLSVSKAGVVPQIATAAKTNNGDNRKLVRKGDFVINSRSDRRGSSGISNYDGSVSLINIVLKPRSLLMVDICIICLKAIILSKSFTEMVEELLLTCGQLDIQK